MILARIAAAHDEQQRHLGSSPGEVAQELQGRRLGPMQIVEHENQRHARRKAADKIGHGLEDEESLGRVVRIRRCRRLDPGSQLRRDAQQLAPALRDVRRQQLDRCAVHACAHDTAERLQRDGRLVAPPVDDRGPASPSNVRDANSPSNDVFPMPGSPLTITQRRPESVGQLPSSASSSSSSATRPTNATSRATAAGDGDGNESSRSVASQSGSRSPSGSMPSQPVATRRSIATRSADGSVPTSSARNVRYSWNVRSASARRPQPASARISRPRRAFTQRVRRDLAVEPGNGVRRAAAGDQLGARSRRTRRRGSR